MEKQEIDYKLNFSLNWEYEVSLSKLKEDIHHLEMLGATHVLINAESSYDVSYALIDAICRRMETDEEFEQRKKVIEARENEIKQHELKTYERLKAKYDTQKQ